MRRQCFEPVRSSKRQQGELIQGTDPRTLTKETGATGAGEETWILGFMVEHIHQCTITAPARFSPFPFRPIILDGTMRDGGTCQGWGHSAVQLTTLQTHLVGSFRLV